MTRPPRTLNISDVAERAGVSPATVSRVMNGNPTVDPELARRVRETAAELGYSANPLARSLVLGRTQTIAVVVPNLANPTFQEILRGISRSASRDGFHVLVADTNETVAEERSLATEARRRTDGLVLCAPRMGEAELTALLPTLTPVVVVNRDAGHDVPVIAADYRSALHDVAQHLYDLGHRRIVYLAGVRASATNTQRAEALDELRRRHNDVSVIEIDCGVSFQDGAGAVDTVIATRATAAIGFNDLVALGLVNGLRSRSVRVPDDISVAGLDDIPFAQFASPPLTSATVPTSEMGEHAWAALHRLIEGREAAPAMFFRPRLQVRESTARAPR
ncbi:LacI family DNA-binding transcriptional regulator [Microbacterium sp. NEAU-LLC]|uniref:LacI family DNA-binding transcriptional regulator n=1 Tax=Microbacterium helvum TaxID=2773713 RepID=A0ABR8NIQ8_9MICO|nr:LacI family DNA-binding transcriptional regulator [Microbacterium helvum]MBD3940580.1 LacI family DNA-binding transcriptional regulator [Microbacterium helvum]